MYFPSLPGEFGHVPRWACDFLRNAFLGEFSGSSVAGPPKRLYINRSKAAHRRVANEDDVIRALATVGFKNVSLESLSIPEQVRLMAKTEIVVAPHGAGLTNIAFCSPGTKILEILSPNDISVVFWSLATQMQLDYYYLLGTRLPASNVSKYEEDILVDIDAMMQTLKLADLR